MAAGATGSRGSKVWYNGRILPVEEARISLFTHALHYGTGAFEGIRAYKQRSGGGAVFRLREHMERLYQSFKVMNFQIPFPIEQATQGVIDTCKANGFDECYVRPIAFITDGPLGVNPGEKPPVDLAILVWEWGKYLADHGADKGARLKISSFIRPHVNASMTKAKISGQYVNSVLAKREALGAGYDEALLLDAEGYLTEGSGENLFIVREGKIKTTPPTSILNGITRQTVIEHLRHQGYEVSEIRFTRDELYCADEVFLTGTAAEITPVTEVDNRPIGHGDQTGKVGPVATRLVREYHAIVTGDLPPYGKNWLTPIR